MCNDAFKQAGITFELHAESSGDYDVPYDTKALSWDANAAMWVENGGQDGKFSNSEVDTVVNANTYPADIDLFYLKNSGKVYDTGDPNSLYVRGVASQPQYGEMFLFVADSQGYIEIATAHEVGHVFDLSNADDDSGSHDNPPYAKDVVDDVENLNPPSAPAGHQAEPNAALLQSGAPQNGQLLWPWGRWMRHEDWQLSNDTARDNY